MVTRRDFIKYTGLAGLGLAFTRRGLVAVPAAEGLSDPYNQFDQAGFFNAVPDALNPGFIHQPVNPANGRGRAAGGRNRYEIGVGTSTQHTGLVDGFGNPLTTDIWGYADSAGVATWPGKTVVAVSGTPTFVNWSSSLNVDHMLPVDTSLHWAYALPGYEGYSIAVDGVPTVPHLHGGHNDFQYDGNPEFFFSPGYAVLGPQWNNVPGGFTPLYQYKNDRPAGTLWYHDHALGITRLNVYAGMAGFYILRDAFDTGLFGNPLGLPAWPYEKAYAIQDRMFSSDGSLFYPAFPGDPFWADFVTDEGLADEDVPQPSALAEFFGDHMVVNGVIWPKESVEPRNYRMRLLNGCDSRFLVAEFYAVPAGEKDFTNAEGPLPFTVVGSDQGLASSPTTVETLLMETGSRYDVVFDFAPHIGKRVIMRNAGGDSPFGGAFGDDLTAEDFFEDRRTDRIMAFDVEVPLDAAVADVTPVAGWEGYGFAPAVGTPVRTRKVALFEGKDEFGRLQPLLGTAEPATDFRGKPINWPATPVYEQAKLPSGTAAPLVGPMEGSIAWHSPTTENPALDTIEEWDIFNVTGDAHPIHLHLVHLEVVGRFELNWDSNTDDDGFLMGVGPAGDGVYLVAQPTVQHNSVAGDPSTYGQGFRIVHPPNPALAYGPPIDYTGADGFVENTPKDMVTALPGQITRIRALFDKKGRYVWHCHILSHEDHEMMRVLHVGPGA